MKNILLISGLKFYERLIENKVYFDKIRQISCRIVALIQRGSTEEHF